MKTVTSPSQADVKMPLNSPEMAAKATSLRQMYVSLPKLQQELVVHFFNLHNAAGCIFNETLSQDARDYVDQQIKYSQELDLLSRQPEDPEMIDSFTEDLNRVI